MVLLHQFSEKTIEENLESRRKLALYRIKLLEKKVKVDEEGDYNSYGGFSSLFVPMLRESVNNFVSLLSKKNGHLNHENNEMTLLLSEIVETKTLLRLLIIYRRIAKLDRTLDEEIAMEGSHICLSKIMKIDINSIDDYNCYNNSSDIDINDGYHKNNEIKIDVNEANQDMIMEIQDLACKIASFSISFPLRVCPLMRGDLLARLPLEFNFLPIPQFRPCVCCKGKDNGNKKNVCNKCTNKEKDSDDDGITILINQVTCKRQSAQKDVGFVMWPSAVVLARWIVSNPSEFRGKRVLELGAGCGLSGLVAAKIVHNFSINNHDDDNRNDNSNNNDTTTSSSVSVSGSNSGCVILSDFNEMVVKNIEGNLELNNLKEIGTAEGLDFYQQGTKGDGWLTIHGVKRNDLFDIIIASDVICQAEDAFAAARSIAATLKEGGKAIMVSADSKHRFGVEKFEAACSAVGSLTISSKINVDDYKSKIVVADDDDMEKTSGFVQGMTLTMYTILKTRAIKH
mmetsp:Transcript_34350/g.37114  ORF Transcript_34350/g.37114 Transcript_34350/m.37114 type:complete len:512 (-) Transcript_34350:285-1820(-)